MHRIPGTAAALAFLVLSIAWTGTAFAAPVLINAGSTPVIVVALRTGTLTVRTWNRNVVQVDTQGTIDWFHATARQVANNLPPTQTVLAQTAKTPFGPVTLPPESFVEPLAPGPHEGVRIAGDGPTTITVPQGTALIMARIGVGSVAVQGYHQGAFFIAVHTGNVALTDVSGTGFAQTVKGRVFIDASSFDRIRVRTGSGNIAFKDCTSQQIEVTSIRGSIGYDNGSFTPGLARFESQYGNIALGIASGGAQVTAHGAAGRVYSEFAGKSNVSITGADATGAIGGGGATVTASAGGAMVLYDGALETHPNIASNVPEVRALLNRTPKFIRPNAAPGVRPRGRGKQPPVSS